MNHVTAINSDLLHLKMGGLPS
ncbi:hypothetical protein LCGC14_2993500, partial [marine sediment metagenome]